MNQLKLLFKNSSESFSGLFVCFVLSVFSLLTISLLLAFSGFYYKPIIWMAFFILALLFSINLLQVKKSFFDKKIIIIGGLVLLWLILIFSFSTPTIFSGRDQGTLSQSAIYLVENHQLNFSFPAEKDFFNIYGVGKALNFPGFYFNSSGGLITQFPLGYISFLAIGYSLLGLVGLKLVNLVAFLIFIGSFYFIAKKIIQPKNTFWPISIVLSSFVFSWFFKFTLGENLVLALLWFAIWQLMEFWEKGDKKYLTLTSLSLGLMLFIRIETLAIILMLGIILWIKNKKIKIITSQFSLSAKIVWLLTAVFFIISFWVNREFFIVIAKSLIPTANDSDFLGDNFWQEIIHSFNVFSIYSLIIFLAFSLLGIVSLIKKRKIGALIPFLLILPTYIYLIDPSISNDHPWMLRRFFYSVIPASFLYTVVFLENFFRNKKALMIFSSLLVVYNLMIMFPYLNFIPQGNLLKETSTISKDFSDQNLILVDRMATGDPYAMMAGPLNSIFKKQAVYFFNPEDLAKIDLTKYNKVFFIIPDDSLDFYANENFFSKLVPQQDYTLKAEFIKNQDTQWQLNLPIREKTVIFGKVYEYKD